MSLKCNHKRPYKREAEGDFTTEEKESGITKEQGGGRGFQRLLLTLKMGKGPEAKECSSKKLEKASKWMFPWQLS